MFRSPFRYRTYDTLGLGLGYAHVSKQAAGLDADNIAFSGNTTPIRGSEKFIELTYQYQVRPWVQVQPDIQYVFRPGAGVSSADDATKRVKDELVVGVRTNIAF